MIATLETSPWKRRVAVVVSLSTVVIVVYGLTLSHGFVWDDHEQILNNPYLREWTSIRDFFTKDVLEITRHEEGDIHSNYYRPLFFIQYLINYQLFEVSGPMWHLAAVVQHLLACLAAYWFARSLGLTAMTAWWAAVLFAVHPVHGESIGWLAAAFNDPPVATLTFAGLALYLLHIRGKRSVLLVGSLIAYLAALGHKESALGMLLLVPLTDWFVFPDRRWTQRFRQWTPYVAVSALYFVIRSFTIGFAFGENPNAKAVVDTLPTFPMLVVYYTRFLFWPFGLGPSYPLRYVAGWGDPRAWALLVVISAVAVALWFASRRDRLMRYCLLWILCTVWPVFNVRAFRETYLVHQRYLYLAVFGLCVFVAVVMHDRVRNRLVRWVLPAVVAAVFSLATVLHIGAWSSDRSLYLRITELDPANVAAWGWLGHDARAHGDLEQARTYLESAMEQDPAHGFAHRELAIMALNAGSLEPAVAHLRQAIAFYENEPQSRRLLIECRENLAGALATMGRFDEALALSGLHAGAPDYSPQSAINAALLLMKQSNGREAQHLLEESMDRNEGNERILETLARVYLQTGQNDRAVEAARSALAVNPQAEWAKELLGVR